MDETNTFNTRLPGYLIARVDEWRKRQTVPPSMAAAVRHLVEVGLRQVGEAGDGNKK